MKSSPTPTERRRAATTLLSQSRRGDRALDGHWPRATSSIQNPQSKIQNLRTAPPPLPLSTPTPNADPHKSLADIQAALACAAAPIALSTLYSHCAKNAFIADHPVHEAKADWIASAPSRLPVGFEAPLVTTNHTEVLNDGATSRWDLWLRNRANDLFRCTLTLIRDNPADYATPCWRIAALEILPHNSG